MNQAKKVINRMMISIICIYLILLLIISSITCYYAFKVRKEQMLSTMDLALAHMDQEYSDILDNFWQAYMPIFEKNSSVYQILIQYFSKTDENSLDPLARQQLSTALNQIRVRDSRIQWIGLYSYSRTTNYLLTGESASLSVMPNDFPYLPVSDENSAGRIIYSAKRSEDSLGSSPCFVICGNDPTGLNNGKLIIGYSINDFVQTSDIYLPGIDSIRCYITSGDQLLFDSKGSYDISTVYLPDEDTEGIVSFQGEKLFIKSIHSGDSISSISYTIPWKQMFLAAHKDTPMIVLLSLLFAVISFFILALMNRSVKREVNVIRDGLNQLADNHLDYRLPTQFQQSGFPEIAQNINEMSARLSETIQKAYYFELKQKDAQLAELQTAFNPHFLYNTLEMLRSKSFANGDVETADLISQLSALFRGFINAKTFISLREELNFANRYFTLLCARYDDMVEIRYNIDSELLDYGIIRNVFQLMIENYFVHGFSGEQEQNYIHFSGKSVDETTMLFLVEDNGIGMNDEDLKKLNDQIAQPIRHGDKSYGLKNLNQRLKLFYGPDYGLKITHGSNGGLCVQIRLKKIRVEDYEKTKVTLNPDQFQNSKTDIQL